MNWLALLVAVLKLVSWVASKVDAKQAEEAILNEFEGLVEKRVVAALSARADVLAGRVPGDPSDPYRRD